MKKTVLITGGSRGIGAATAIEAARLGWNVAISYRSNSLAAENTVRLAEKEGADTLAVQADVASESDILNVFAQVESHFGRLDALVNNAGILAHQRQLVDIDADRIHKMFAVNVVGSFICAREAVKKMSRSRGGDGGSIVNISSAASRIGSANEFIDYAASKGAIDTMTIGLSKEVANQGIRVNAVRPGLINTDMQADSGDRDRTEKLKSFIPMQRPGEAQEVAEAIVWLISEKASYINGAFIDVSGGR